MAGRLAHQFSHKKSKYNNWLQFNSSTFYYVLFLLFKRVFRTWRRQKLLFQFVHVLVSARWIRLGRLRFIFCLQSLPPQLGWGSRFREQNEWAKRDGCKRLQCTVRQDNPSSSYPPLTVFRGHLASPFNGRRCNIKQAAIVPRLGPMLPSEEILASLASGTSGGSGWFRLNSWGKPLVTEIYFFPLAYIFCRFMSNKR